MARLLTASAIWNLHTNGKFKKELKETFTTPDLLAREYSWEEIRRCLKSLQTHRVTKKHTQNQDCHTMLKSALWRRFPFYDVWTHSFSCWIVSFEGRVFFSSVLVFFSFDLSNFSTSDKSGLSLILTRRKPEGLKTREKLSAGLRPRIALDQKIEAIRRELLQTPTTTLLHLPAPTSVYMVFLLISYMIIMGWIVSLQNSYVGVLTPSTS